MEILLDVVVVEVLVLGVILALPLFVTSRQEFDQLQRGLRPHGDARIVGAADEKSLDVLNIQLEALVRTHVKRVE